MQIWMFTCGLVPVLEEVPDPPVTPVEGSSVAREQASQAAGKGTRAGADEEVGVILEERPCEDTKRAALGQCRESRDEVGPVASIPKDGLPLEATHHDMVQDSRRIEARLSRHG